MDPARLFDRYAVDVRRFLASCESSGVDLTQTVLWQAQLSDPAVIDNIRSYLFRIAANLATNSSSDPDAPVVVAFDYDSQDFYSNERGA